MSIFVKPTLLTAMRNIERGITQAEQRIATNKRVNSASDDPLAFSRITITKTSISATAVKLDTLELGMMRLDARDQTLDAFQDALMRFQELATMASTGIHQLKDVLPEMEALEEALLSLANTKDASGRMFAGTANTTPFVRDPVTSEVVYAGNSDAHTIDVEGVKINGSVSGEPLMEAFNAVRDVLAAVRGGTPPSGDLVQGVADSLETVLAMRTTAAAQGAAAKNILASLTSRHDRENDEVYRMEAADVTAETIRLTEGQKHYESVLKVTGMELTRRRLMDFI